MSIPLTINGVIYDYPQTDDTEWGPDATDWAAAVTSGMLQKAGGLFQLLAEVDFGTSYGPKSLYYKTRTSNVADSGQFRLARADVVSWRNQANSANLDLAVNSSDQLTFNGTTIQGSISVSDTSTIDLTLAGSTLSADIVALSISDSLISASASIAFSKLATMTAGNILVGNGSNVPTSTAVTGDVTISSSGVTAIGANKVLNSMLAQMAQSTFKGRAASSGTGDPVDLTATQATAILNAMVGDSGSGGTKGLVPAPAAGDAAANKFLKADGSWTSPAGAGDVVGPASSTDSGFARFDGTTGKLLKNSAATLADADIASNAAIALSKLAALTANRALQSDGSGVVSASSVTATELGYLSGVTSAIQTQLDALLAAIVPSGTVAPYAGSSAPSNWLLCYGQAVSRSTYSALFSAIGTAYGTGDGSTTFNLPDLRGRAIAGRDDMGGAAASRLTSTTMSPNGTTLGATGGTQTHQLTTSEMPSHTHVQDAHTHTQNAHSHTWGANTVVGAAGGAGGPTFGSGASSTSSTTATNQNTTATNQNTGGDGAHLNVQPTLVMNWIIKT